MTTPRLLLAPATALLLGLTACSSALGGSSAPPPPPTTTTILGANTPAQTQAAELRAHLTALLVEHAYLLAASTATDGSAAATQLAANSSDVARILGQAYPPDFSSQFLAWWTARITDIQAYAKAAAAKDDAATKAASTKLSADSLALARFLHDNNKYLAVTTVSSPPSGIGDELSTDNGLFTAWADATAAGDATTVTKLIAAAEAMPHGADVLASATAKLFPAVYAGTPTGTAANLRASLSTMLVEHVVLAINTFGLIAGGQAAGPQRLALDANTTSLHNAFAAVYDDNVAAAFTTKWKAMIDGLAANSTSQLGAFADDFGAFIAKTTGHAADAEVTTEIQAQIAAVQQAISDAGGGRASDLFVQLRTGVAAAVPLASTLAELISEQMPARYLP